MAPTVPLVTNIYMKRDEEERRETNGLKMKEFRMGNMGRGSGRGSGHSRNKYWDVPPNNQNVSGSSPSPCRCVDLTLSLLSSAPSKSGAMTSHSRIGPEVVAIALLN
jgi:hypothetical protein